MRKFKEKWHNLVDGDKYGGVFEDILIGTFFGGVMLLFLYAIAKSLGVF